MEQLFCLFACLLLSLFLFCSPCNARMRMGLHSFIFFSEKLSSMDQLCKQKQNKTKKKTNKKTKKTTKKPKTLFLSDSKVIHFWPFLFFLFRNSAIHSFLFSSSFLLSSLLFLFLSSFLSSLSHYFFFPLLFVFRSYLFYRPFFSNYACLILRFVSQRRK